MKWVSLELQSLFDLLKEIASSWRVEDVLPNTIRLGKIVLHQLDKYEEGKYRSDRNEAKGFFSAIDKFADTGLAISLDHFNNLIDSYKKRILPYPHYSGIIVKVPEALKDINTIDVQDIPN